MHKTAIDGSKAREIMDNEGLSVAEVSRRMGVTRMTVYNLLKGDNTTLDVLTAFCVALNNVNPLDIDDRRLSRPSCGSLGWNGCIAATNQTGARKVRMPPCQW